MLAYIGSSGFWTILALFYFNVENLGFIPCILPVIIFFGIYVDNRVSIRIHQIFRYLPHVVTANLFCFS
jgi:hypothetical protein